MNFRETLAQMQAAYAAHPPHDIRLSRPAWLTDADGLSAIYREKSALLRGEICYAHIVQANSILFKFFPHKDCPAQIIYSTDPIIAADPRILADIARDFYRYKNKPLNRVPPQWQDIAASITSEYDRSGFTFTLELEQGLVEFHMVPVMIFRALLPGRVLRGSLMPILTAPGCRSALVLPKRYWTAEFKNLWRSHMI